MTLYKSAIQFPLIIFFKSQNSKYEPYVDKTRTSSVTYLFIGLVRKKKRQEMRGRNITHEENIALSRP